MLYATGSAGLATLVRGSSRRIKIMRFRPANIRLINRRSNLPRLLLALFSEDGENNSNDKNNDNDNDKNNPTDVQELTWSLHIRAFSTQVLTESTVPHPLCALCTMGGKAQRPRRTVNSWTENALVVPQLP